jgi:osmotically-inducible protein OsmY
MTRVKSTLTRELMRALTEDPHTAESAIDVVDNNGVATLTGFVPSDEIREAAEVIVGNQVGVITVVNDLEVRHVEEEVTGLPIVPIHLRNV